MMAGMESTTVGTVGELRRYPVKSMLGETLVSARVGAKGFEGDRAHALVDDETRKIASVKRPRLWGRLFELRAMTNGTVFVAFPDGTELGIDDPALPDRLSDFLGRRVSIASTPPEDAAYDEVWERDLKGGVDPMFGRDSTMVDGEEMIEGGATMRMRGDFNAASVHLVTTGSTRHLTELAAGVRVDPHRFRPNVVVDTEEVGFVENEWLGRRLRVGTVELEVTLRVVRCVMPTLAQEDLAADRRVLRAIAEHNMVDPGIGDGAYPCLGVYAEVVTPGEVRVGDPVVVL